MLHRGKFLEFRVDTVERSDGSRATRDFAGHPGAVAIVALDAEGRVALVRQWRLAANDALLEIPAGGLDLAADGSKEEPERAARRELEEETGVRAGSWRKLGEFYSAPGFTDELMHLYVATDLAAASADGRLGPDEDERLILEWRPWQDAVKAAERGEIRDAKSIVGLFWLARVIDEVRPCGWLGPLPAAGFPVRPEARQRVPVQRRVWAERDSHPQMGPRLVSAPELLQALAQRVMRVRRGRVEVEDPLEGGPCELVLGGVEVGAPEGLEDRCLAGFQAIRPLEHDGGLRVMTRGQQRLAALEQLVGRLTLWSVVLDLIVHDQMVA